MVNISLRYTPSTLKDDLHPDRHKEPVATTLRRRIPVPRSKSSWDSARSEFNKDAKRPRVRNAITVAGHKMNKRLVLLRKQKM